MPYFRDVGKVWARLLYWGSPATPYVFITIVLGAASLLASIILGLIALGRWLAG
jgi:hypothetical protein